jgi:hypothetical protein
VNGTNFFNLCKAVAPAETRYKSTPVLQGIRQMNPVVGNRVGSSHPRSACGLQSQAAREDDDPRDGRVRMTVEWAVLVKTEAACLPLRLASREICRP